MVDAVIIALLVCLLVVCTVNTGISWRTYRETVDPDTDAEMERFFTTVHQTSRQVDGVRVQVNDGNARIRNLETSIGWLVAQQKRSNHGSDGRHDQIGQSDGAAIDR